jgi:hypothetical protein
VVPTAIVSVLASVVIAIMSLVLAMATAVFLAPTAVILALLDALVGPVAGLIAIGVPFPLVLGTNPASATLAGFFPTAGGPGPAVILAVPITRDPDIVPAGTDHADFHPWWRWGFGADANANRA